MVILKKLISPYLAISTLVLTPFLLSAQENLDTAINALTDQINKYMVEQKKTKIAIIPFPDIQKQAVTVLGSYIAEELTTNLFSTGKFKIVERSLLKQVLDELKLGQTGVVDSTSAKQLGRMAGVDAIIAGTITNLGSNIAINCRLIETESGEVFAAAKAKFAKDIDIAKLLEEETNNPEIKKEKDELAEDKSDWKINQAKYVKEWGETALKVELATLRRLADDKIEANFIFTNVKTNGDTIYLRLQRNSENNYISDINGNRYNCIDSIGIIESKTSTLAKDVPYAAKLIYPKLEKNSDIISIVIDLSGFPLLSFTNIELK